MIDFTILALNYSEPNTYYLHIMKKIELLISLTFIFILHVSATAQTAFQLDAEQTEVSVDGTSTLHDWTMNLEKGRSAGTATFQLDGTMLSGIDALRLTFESEGLKSGKGPMDNNAYRALKTDENPEITFELRELQEIKETGEGVLATVLADLTIAGFTNPVTMTATCTVAPDEVITCSGSQALKMTDFEVKPPSIMLGSVKTGDDLTINYRAVFVK